MDERTETPAQAACRGYLDEERRRRKKARAKPKPAPTRKPLAPLWPGQHLRSKRWIAYVRRNGRRVSVGTYPSRDAAIKARDRVMRADAGLPPEDETAESPTVMLPENHTVEGGSGS